MINNAKPCAGIYRIVSPSGHFYIGSSVNMRVRVRAHKYQLGAKIHNNKFLQMAFEKYGGALIGETICQFDGSPSDLLSVEQKYLDRFRPKYNVSKTAGVPSTYADTGSKISAALKGRPKSDAVRANMSASAKLRPPVSEETRAKMSASGRGRKKSIEHRQKIAAASAKHRHSDETKAKMSAAKLNGRQPRDKSGVGRGKGSPGYPKPRGPWPQSVKDKIGASHRKRSQALRAEKEAQSAC